MQINISSNKKKILFVSHDATRTGAPIILLNFLRWFKNNNKSSFSILLKTGGALAPDFGQTAPIYYLEVTKNLVQRVATKVLRAFIKRKSIIKLTLDPKLKKQKFDLIYLNTVVSLDLAYLLKSHFKCPVIAHIHENEFALKVLFPDGIDKTDIDSVNRFIAVSESTKLNLINNYNVPEEKVALIYEFTTIHDKREITVPKQELIKQLDLRNSFIVGGSGDCNWRKGVDLFIQLAVVFNKFRPGNNIKLMWVGRLTHEFICQKDYELKRLGVADMIIFTGAKPDPQNYFQLFDVFALTSREDPFPLVALEAASMEKPVIFFEKAGGMSELFINDKGGIKTAFGNVEDMANAILEMNDNPEKRIMKGIEAAGLVKNYDIDIIAKKIADTIDIVVNNNQVHS